MGDSCGREPESQKHSDPPNDCEKFTVALILKLQS